MLYLIAIFFIIIIAICAMSFIISHCGSNSKSEPTKKFTDEFLNSKKTIETHNHYNIVYYKPNKDKGIKVISEKYIKKLNK